MRGHKELEPNQDGKAWTTRPEHNENDEYCDCVDCYCWRIAHAMTWRGASFEDSDIEREKQEKRKRG